MLLVAFSLWVCWASESSLAFQPLVPRNIQHQQSKLHTTPPFMVAKGLDYYDAVLQSRLQELQRAESILANKSDAIAAGLVSASAPVSEEVSASQSTPMPLTNYPAKQQKPQADSNILLTKEPLNGDEDLRSFRPVKDIASNTTTSLEGGDLVCRVVAMRDGKLPDVHDATVLPKSLVQSPTKILSRLDDLYHAHAHQETRLLKYMQRSSTREVPSIDAVDAEDSVLCESEEEEKDLVVTVRHSLEDAGFERLSRRDLDLCEALNAGYLLRLSILPDVSRLDPSIAQEFYPEYFDAEGEAKDPRKLSEQLLFDGRVLVFWRGYSQEVTRGRLLLPKIDYLQANLVQRLSGSIKRRLDVFERFVVMKSLVGYRKTTACFIHYLRALADRVPNDRISKSLRRTIRSPYTYSAYKAMNNGKLPTLADLRATAGGRTEFFKLSRYGGSKIKFVGSPNPTDALNPFIICEENSDSCSLEDDACKDDRASSIDRDMYESLNRNELRCPYDASSPQSSAQSSFQLLDRVSISSLVDIFTREGRRNLVQAIFSKSELVEPTYEEVVVVWRPLPDKQGLDRPKLKPPQFAYDVADMFDIKGLPEKPKEQPKPARKSLEIRAFEGVPMANLPAVLPKTKLVFRPADAFVFDLVSIFSFLLIAGSLRFDNPKLDVIALVSVSLWLIRTVFRYSNKLARYDLLVKKFLTSKLSHRNSGALKYLASQAGSQRATRAALVHKWLCSIASQDEPLERSRLIAQAKQGVNALIDDLKETPIDVDAALNDLEDLGLVQRTDEKGRHLQVLRDDNSIVRTLTKAWRSLFAGTSSLRALIGRRRRRRIASTDQIPAP